MGKSTTTSTAATETAAAEKTSTEPTARLPENYCADGRLTDAEGIIRPEYLEKTAEEIAQALKSIKASAFYGAFLRDAKDLRKKKVPYAAKKNYAQGLAIQAKKLVYRKREPAPGMLVEMMQRVAATVTSAEAFEAMYMHLDAVYSYMLEE